jgi:hypothetical protein
VQFEFNAESVRQFQPTVALWQPWEKCAVTQCGRNSFRVATKQKHVSYPQGFKANPGLEFANTFGVKFKLQQYSVSDCYPINCKGCHDNDL